MWRRCVAAFVTPRPAPYPHTLVTMACPSTCPVPGPVLASMTSLPSQPSPTPTGQFYRRMLPASCISFSSTEGKQVFKEAIQAGHMEGYFGLAAQFRTQDEPAFCGLSTLVMVLNTLEVDPKRVWKGVWRWYHENMLDCCVSLDRVAKLGITMDEFACIASCNTLNVNMVRANEEASEEEFRAAVKKLTRCTDEVAVVTYSRKVLDQTGDGHFSPVGGYHPERDLVLVLDTARFKYPPHWVSLPLLFKAMKASDKDTGSPRGYLQLRRSDTVPLVLFRWDSGVSLPMLNVDQRRSTGLSKFQEEWQQWLFSSSPSPHPDILQTAVGVIISALSHIEAGNNILTTQIDIRCPKLLSTEHSCILKDLLQSLESVPLFRMVENYLKENPEVPVHIAEDLVKQVKCKSEEISENGASASEECGSEIILKSAHFVTTLLFAWPSPQCGNSTGHEFRKAVQGQLCNTRPVLQYEVSQLSRQFSMLMKHEERCKDCQCGKMA